MTKNNAAVVVPAIIACLVICALVLFTCKYCYNPQFLWRLRRGDVESSYGSSSDGEKPPSGVVLSHEVVSVSSSSDFSSSISSVPQAIAVVEAHPDDDGHPDATVIAVAPNEPPVIEASPPRESRFGLGRIF